MHSFMGSRKEDNNMQTWEMIKCLTENPKLKFEYDTGSEQGIVGVVNGNINVILCNNRPEDSYLRLHSGFMKINWKLYKEPVTWQEAFQAWMEGKEFYVEINGDTYQQKSKELLGSLHYSNGFFADMFTKGKWYIKD